ncbi:hypothetical protein ACFVGY_15445 [Streptomyces sp. NPDC127106]|uniref:hypothetical protein n=1 Tax=Streptomyces sp. NPDC127106 TaxID=3345360 RepID=UPI00362FCBEE
MVQAEPDRAAQHADRTVAVGLLADLDPQADWDGPVLRLAPPRARQRALSRAAAGPGLLLIPSVFKPSGLSPRLAPPEPAAASSGRQVQGRSGMGKDQ